MKNILHKPLSEKELFTSALFKRPESLSKFLPYDEYIEEKKIFVMKDGSLGAVFDLELVDHEPKTEKSIIKIVNSSKDFFNLPENCTLQFLYDQSIISTRDKRYQDYIAYSNANPLSDYLFKEKLDLIKNSHAGSPFERKCTISVRYFPKISNKSSIFDQGNSTLYRYTKDFIRELRSFEHIIANFSSFNSLNITQLDADRLLQVLRKFFNPESFYKRDFAKFTKNSSLSNQFLYNSPILDYSSIEREGLKTRTLTLKCAPSFVYAGGMSYFTNLDFPYSLSLNFSFPSKQKTKFFFDTKEFFLRNALSERAKAQREEIQSVQKNLARDDRCLYLTFNIIIDGKDDEELDDKERKVANVFQKLECEIIKEDDIGLGLCINTLPLCYSPEADVSANRYIRILKKDAINLLPIFDSFRGMKSPLLVYPSRQGNIVPFSLLDKDNGTSHHTVICADTGSGKSTLISDLIWSSKRIDPEMITFVVDKKSSYGMLCEYFDGDMTKFDRNGENQFSPFRGVYDEEKYAFLTKLFTFAISLTSPSFNLESEHQTAINKALRLAYTKKKSRHGLEYLGGELVKRKSNDAIELEMQDFITELGQLSDENESIQETCQELINKLSPFYGQGVYAKFFKGAKSNKEKSKLFYIYDLDALARDPILLPLMSLTVIEEIRSILELPENKGRAGLLILEEFAMLGKNNPIISDFIVEFAETMRKRGCWLISATPRPRNFFELSQGRALFETADNYLFLQMSDDNIEYIANQSTLFDEANKEIISSLNKIDGLYSEVFYMNKKKTICGAFRNFQTPSGRWLSPNNAKDAHIVEQARKNHSNTVDLLNYLIEQHS